MIRLSRLTDYGVVLTSYMAGNTDRCHNAFDLAAATGLPAPTVSKILATLTRAGLLISHRGAKGGYHLARNPEAISAADIVSALDGPVALTLCIEHGDGACDVEMVCPSRQSWRRINDAVRQALEGVSLAEMAFPSLPGALQSPVESVGEPSKDGGAPPTTKRAAN